MTFLNFLSRIWANMPRPLRNFIRFLAPLRFKIFMSKVIVGGVNRSDFVTDNFGFSFKFINDGHFNHVLFDGIYEPFVTGVVRKFLREGDVVFDVGANFGWFAIHSGSIVGSSGLVYAVEMSPYTAKILAENISTNSLNNIKIINACIDSIGGVNRRICFDEDGCDPLAHALQHGSGERRVESIVGSITLDDISYMRYPVLVKLDVEGFEINALNGAANLLNIDTAPVLIIEFNEHALSRNNSNCNELAKILIDHGFEMYVESRFGGRLVRSMHPFNTNVFCLGTSDSANRFRKIFNL